MSKISGQLTASHPIPWYKRNVTFDPKSLFKAFGEAAVDLIDGQRVSAGKKIFDAISAGSLQNDTTGLGWLLITKSLANAAARIAKESRDHIQRDPESINLDHLNQDAENFFKKLEIEITPDFLDHPERLPVIEDMKAILKKWLLANDMEPHRVDTAVQRLNDYFVLELDLEWRESKADYKPLEDLLTSPFKPAADMNRAWVTYHAMLKERLREPLFGVETFDITQVYVPLRAYYALQDQKPKRQMNEVVPAKISHDSQKYYAVDLHQYLNDWIDKGLTSNKNSLKVITGGPGSGKSTFVRTFASEISEKGQVRVLCIRLHDFDTGADFKKGLGDYVKDQDWFDDNPLESGESLPILVILDGLDELPLQRNEAMENAREFIGHINTFLSRYQARRLFVVITGRTLVVEHNLRELSEDEQVLHLLPYFIKEPDFKKECEPVNILEVDQRDEWWKKYGEATGLPYPNLPTELSQAGEKVDDLTAQPLLNYLVALTLKAGAVDFSKEPNIALIYGDLLRQIYQGINNNETVNPMIRALNQMQFETLLQEVAIAVWHGNAGRIATFGDIMKRCKNCDMENGLIAISQDTSSGLLRLLTAFYFRQYGGTTQDKKIIEFTHKSFYEYLVARRIVEEISLFAQQFESMKENHQIEFTEKKALKRWCELCGPNEINYDLYNYITNIIHLNHHQRAQRWQLMLISLFDYMIQYGMPMEQIEGELTYKRMVSQSTNAEEALLAAISACATISSKIVSINWGTCYGLGLWLRKLQGQKNYSTIALKFFNHQSLINQRIPYIVMAQGVFYHSDFQRSDLQGANLMGANLKGVNFQQAFLQGANLQQSNLRDVNLRGAILKRALIQGANLQGANLRQASFKEAKLRDAILLNANCNGTNFKRTQGLSVVQLSQTKTLYQAKIDPDLKQSLERHHPHLFKKC